MAKQELAITSFSVLSSAGHNKKPSIGHVTFSDGKSFQWSTCDTGIEILGRRGPQGYKSSFKVNSPKREALVKHWLENNY